MGRKVRKTLNIDGEKLRRVQRYLGLETETEAIDHVLDVFDSERELATVLRRTCSSSPGSVPSCPSPT